MTVTIPENEEAEEAEAEGGDREAGGRRERRPALRPEEVGVIVPYRAQAMQIMKMMKASGSVDGWMVGLVGFVWVAGESPLSLTPINQSIHPPPPTSQEKGLATQGPSAYVKVATVDSFQGAEREVIVYSCVRTAGLGFLDSPHRCVPCLACVFAVH